MMTIRSKSLQSKPRGGSSSSGAPVLRRQSLASALQQDMEQDVGHDFSRLPVYAKTPVRRQPTLAVGTPGDIYEQEADRVAEQVINARESAIQRQAQPLSARQEGHAIQIRQSAERSASQAHPIESSEVPPILHDVINTSGRPLDSNTRGFFEPSFGYDFSRVRVHDDASAHAATHALNARAFTVGADMVFASGEFQAKTLAGRALLAHELAHVIQQSGGSPAGEGSPGLHAAKPAIQRSVRTMGGSWDATKYDLVRKEDERDVTGVDIALNFRPEDPVDAELIGLTQTVRLVRKGKQRFVEESSKRRATTAGEQGVETGAHIDQPKNANPLYATGEADATDTLATTPVALPGVSVTGEIREHGQHGWHYRNMTGTLQHQNAILNDRPLFRDPAENSSQTFETTALAIKGRQEGTYYGSVKWGWETDASGTLTRMPLSVAAAGVPTATFMRAAELWNAATTAAGAATIDLPTSKLPSSAKLPTSYSTAGLAIEIFRINKELASMPAGTDKTNKAFEKAALDLVLAKRPDKPTSSVADQEKAAAALSTPDLIKRATALPEEIWKLHGEPWAGSTTNKEIESDAVNREIRKRMLHVTVHVHDTEDVFSDNVYVEAPSGAAKWSSSVVKLNSGDEHTFVAPLSSVFPESSVDPASSPLLVKAFDEDVDGDDLMFEQTWAWTDLPATQTQSRDGGKYTVRIDYA